MNRKHFTAMLLGAALVCINQPLLAETKSYPMVCHGGPGMTASFERKIRFDKPDQYILTVQFKRGGSGAGSSTPAPGYCAWLDRGVADSEPAVLVHTRTGNNPLYQLTVSPGRVDIVSMHADEQHIVGGVRDSALFYVRAKRDKARFVVTKVGP